jgi:hypothetical protein
VVEASYEKDIKVSLQMLGRIKNIIIFISLVGFLSSFLDAKKGSDGLYEYDYCIAKRGEKSKIFSTNDSFSTSDKMIISGQVFEIKSKETIWGAIVSLQSDTSDSIITQLTDSLGRFSFAVLPQSYMIKVRCVGFSDFESEIRININTNRHVKIGLGTANGFVTYGIKSKRKLTKCQLKMKALKLSRKSKTFEK